MLYFVIFVTFLTFGAAGFAQPILQHGFGFPIIYYDGWEFIVPAWLSPVFVIVGVLWIIVTMHLAQAIGRFHGALAKVLLVRD